MKTSGIAIYIGLLTLSTTSLTAATAGTVISAETSTNETESPTPSVNCADYINNHGTRYGGCWFTNEKKVIVDPDDPSIRIYVGACKPKMEGCE